MSYIGSTDILHTRFRYIRSKSLQKIMEYINTLPYKIEIKGGVTWDGKKYLVSFVPPEDKNLKEKEFGELD